MDSVWLIVPTYDEAGTVEPLIRAAATELRRAAPGAWRIYVVDDSSPDGTGLLVEALAESMPELAVEHRPRKAGLGRAYLSGFRRALDEGADVVMQIDADLSHDPADIPRLLSALADADLVLGSRYVDGGGVRDWGFMRRQVSRAGCLYARIVLRARVRDLTGGFKVFRRSVLEAIDLDGIRSEGYAFQIELTYRALRSGFRVLEIPITFRERRAGQSKMSLAIALEAALLVPRMPRYARGR